MEVSRRSALRALAAVVATIIGLPRLSRAATATSAGTLGVRTLDSSDATQLRTIMMTCVSDAESFYGKCGEWSLGWAEEFIASRPDTPLILKGGVAIAFHEVPPIKDPLPPLLKDASEEEHAKQALRERNRRTFRVSAAGVRDDLLSPEESVAVFRQIIYQAYKRARAMGYEYAECFAPWDKHPRLEKKFTDYPGLELVEKVAEGQDGGRSVFWLKRCLVSSRRHSNAESSHRLRQ